ncbi:MAG: hypothetical protein QOJ50_220, partial [Cryptosporangiaceae bacterium]|nr:hypothetical protein [Cryptosporangiaceae bacterium]
PRYPHTQGRAGRPRHDGQVTDSAHAQDVRYQEARRLYFRYEGSSFHLERDGQDFGQYGVPAGVERRWAAELKHERLAALSEPANWPVIWFLRHHGYLGHLSLLVATPPRGRLHERIAYLEELLGYVDACADPRWGRTSPAYDPAELAAAAGHVAAQAELLIPAARSDGTRQRIQRVIAGAGARRAVWHATGRLWVWDPPTGTASPQR